MKRFAMLSVCVLLAIAGTAKADIVGVTTLGNVKVSATIDTSNPSFDVWDIFVTDITGDSVSTLGSMQGVWTATGGTFRVRNAAATTATFKNATAIATSDLGYSEVNLSAAFAAAVWARDGGTTFASSFIQGTWTDNQDPTNNMGPPANVMAIVGGDGSLDPDANGFNNNLLAIMRVSKGTTKISFDGLADGGFGYSPSGDTMGSAFSVTLPEPSTLALLGVGAISLLGYGWRRRKGTA
jgi:PEP-CTERM motif